MIITCIICYINARPVLDWNFNAELQEPMPSSTLKSQNTDCYFKVEITVRDMLQAILSLIAELQKGSATGFNYDHVSAECV